MRFGQLTTSGKRTRSIIGLGLLVLALAVALTVALIGRANNNRATGVSTLSAYEWRVEVYAVSNCSVSAVCSYFGKANSANPLRGEDIAVYQNHKKIFTAQSNAKGYAVVKLPKGTSTVWFSHHPYLGQNWAVRNYSITTPISHNPGSKYDFILDTGPR